MKRGEWRRRLGERGEELAAAYLQDRGYLILERNYRGGGGEMDIVAREGESIVFLEVRARSSEEYGTPEESITSTKIQRLIEVAESWLQEKDAFGAPWRIDVIAIELSSTFELHRLEHIVNAVTR